MAPLVFAILRARTPSRIATLLIDERAEPFAPQPTDLVAITIETFTARRGYEIADHYRSRGVPVVVGGHHPSMLPEEAAAHADAVVIGDAEGVWEDVLEDVEAGRIQQFYRHATRAPGDAIRFDRTVFAGKRYGPITLVQAGRGCRFACDFCSIHAFYGTHREQRPPEDVAAEIAALPDTGMIFFVDDNLYWRREEFLALMRALKPLRRAWSCQITIDVARDDELLNSMADAGCALVLIGFESLSAANLKQMRKKWSKVSGEYPDVIARLHSRGIMIYGTFVFGYDGDRPEGFLEAARFARAQNMAIANFNPLTPMPGTGLYRRLEETNALLRPEWWIDPDYRYGDAIFCPAGMSTHDLRDGPMQARRLFYSWRSILSRAARGAMIWRSSKRIAMMLVANVVSRREIARKQARSLSADASLVVEPAE